MVSQNAFTTGEQEIRQVIEDRVEAIRRKDVEALSSAFVPDVVMYNLAPPLQSRGTHRESIEKWLSGYQSAINYEVRDLAIATSGDVAFCHYLYRVTGTLLSGQEVDMWVRATLCLRKVGGKWLITHEHDSEPFDMETLEALLDLKP